jgi:hypothetical protein
MTDKIKNFNRSFPRDFAFVQRTVAKSLHVESVPVKEVTDLVSV